MFKPLLDLLFLHDLCKNDLCVLREEKPDWGDSERK